MVIGSVRGARPCPVAVIRGSEPQVPRRAAVRSSSASTGRKPAAPRSTSPRSGGVARGRLVAVRATADAVAEPAEAQLAAVRFRYPALPVEERVVDGTAQRARQGGADARLLVIGRHRAGSGIDVMLGATGHGLVESVPCPVLIAGPRERDLTDSASGPEQAAR